MEVVYAGEDTPNSYSKSIFLVGPTPRSDKSKTWRPAMIQSLTQAGYDGVVFSPEHRGGIWQNTYDDQVEWEKKHLELADLILVWLPRTIEDMPAFTTNVEFGRWVSSGKILYGRPDWATKVRYLDWMYTDHTGDQPYNDMAKLAAEATRLLGDGAIRSGGELHIPLHVWNTEMFQSWYASQKAAKNRLDDAKVLWSLLLPKRKFMPSHVLRVKIWVQAEGRHEDNIFILSRTSISFITSVLDRGT